VERITGKKLRLIRGDSRDRIALTAALYESGASAVIHFAGLKAVGESVEQPLAYYDNNVIGTFRLNGAFITVVQAVKSAAISSELQV
jgi:UDP-glucose 4-epimerase